MQMIGDDALACIFSFLEKKSWFCVMTTCKRFLSVGLRVFLELEEKDNSISLKEQVIDAQAYLAGVHPKPSSNYFFVAEIPANPQSSFSFQTETGVQKYALNELQKSSVLSEIESHCEKAPFGKRTKTIYNDGKRAIIYSFFAAVRCNLQMESSKIIETPLFLPQEIMNAIRLKLAPYAIEVRAELNKFLMYRQGDFFKPHKDTIRAVSHIGTLIVVLPTRPTGGFLVLRHMGKQKFIEFQSANFGVVAFYTDIEHEITPVLSGYRLAFTYNLYLGAEISPSHIAKSRVLTGFILEHDYSLSTLDTKMLKGNDKLLYEHLEGAKRFKMKLIPVEIVDYSTTQLYWGNFIHYIVFKINPSKVQPISGENESYRVSKLYDSTSKESNKVFFLTSMNDFGFKFKSYIRTETGNEGAQFMHQYIQAALVMKLIH